MGMPLCSDEAKKMIEKMIFFKILKMTCLKMKRPNLLPLIDFPMGPQRLDEIWPNIC